MNIEIPDTWLPTSENINALPKPLRDLIMRLHANTDPAGELRRAMIAEMERDALRKMIAEAPEAVLTYDPVSECLLAEIMHSEPRAHHADAHLDSTVVKLLEVE